MTSRSNSPSEGEIIESDSEKATKSLPSANGTLIDRQSSKRRSTVSRSPSPVRSTRSRSYRSRSRSRSPYRAPRGSKRSREDDHYNERYDRSDRRDPRNFRVHYEDRRLDKSRPHQSSYRDHDRPAPASSGLRYDDRSATSRPNEKRLRTISRSPPRFSDRRPGDDKHNRSKREGQSSVDDRNSGAKAKEGRYSREQSVSERGSTPAATASSRTETEQKQTQTRKGVSFKLAKSSEADEYVPPLDIDQLLTSVSE